MSAPTMVRHSMSAITMVTLLSVIRTDTCQHSDSAEKFVPRILNLENCQMRMQIYYEGSKSASWIHLTPENLQESQLVELTADMLPMYYII